MKYIGYILSNNKLKINLDFIKNITSIEEYDKKYPLLIIGLDNAKIFNKDNFSILNKKITELIYWTYKRTEKRIDYEKDISLFNSLVIKNIINTIPYISVPLFKGNFSSFKRLISLLCNNNDKIIYETNYCYFMLYENVVYGFSKEEIEYDGISLDKINKFIKKQSKITIINSNNFLSFQSKRFIGRYEYIIPYLYSIK